MFNDKVKSKDVASSSLIAGGFAADSKPLIWWSTSVYKT